MDVGEFTGSLQQETPPVGLSEPMLALWWDGKGDWQRAHAVADELTTLEGMAVHAYLHRKEGEQWNADYWYGLAGRLYHRSRIEDEWEALVTGLLQPAEAIAEPDDL